MTTLPFLEPANIARWRQAIALKGMEVNGQLTQLLAKQNATLATIKLPNEEKPGEKPVERLRRFLNQIIAAQRRLGSDQFGKCQSCGLVLPVAALNETPWLQDCGPCFAKTNSTALPF
ncbi:MAG: hypothetical protein EXR77_14295 [Myxococcales bacterium]|nr:hypothetical protein [Myxococcales bacterium]